MSALDSMLSGFPADQAEMPEWLTTYLAMEQSATALRAHEPRAVYGMLQTPRYVEHLAGRAGISGVSSSFVQRTIDQRLHRQKRVRNGDLQVEVIQPESALHLRVGDPSVMAEQLRTMAELADLPNVTVRITTYDAGQYEARRLGDFAIVTPPVGPPAGARRGIQRRRVLDRSGDGGVLHGSAGRCRADRHVTEGVPRLHTAIGRELE